MQAVGCGSHSPGFLILLNGNAKMPQALVFNFGELHMHKSIGTTPPPSSKVGLQRLRRRSQEIWVLVLALPLTGCATLPKSLCPQFPLV